MAQVIFTNLATSTLAGSITNTAVTLNLQAGGGALFPNPAVGQYFTLTLVDAATSQLNEIMWCTARTGDTLTVIRAQEGTSALAWNAGDIASNKITAGTLNNFVQSVSQSSLVHYGVGAGTNNITSLVNPSITAITDGTLVELTPSANNTGAVTFNANSIGAAPVVNRDGSALASGTLVASQPVQLMALGGQWILMTQPASSTIPQAALVHYGTASGVNTMTTTVSPSISALSDGMQIAILPGSSNTGSCTLSANSLPYYPIVFPNGAALTSGAIVAGQPALLIYIGGNFYLLTSQQSTGGFGVGIGQWIQTAIGVGSGNSPYNYGYRVGLTTITGSQLIAGTAPSGCSVGMVPVGDGSGYLGTGVYGTPTGNWVIVGWSVTMTSSIAATNYTITLVRYS